ncbi:hypothetical protein [Marinobacter adhaerens]|uniref:hypothetical protein n=1 Tax=Marinobacter adhaerens TaxID=1033846 RepID=UPI003D0DE887
MPEDFVKVLWLHFPQGYDKRWLDPSAERVVKVYSDAIIETLMLMQRPTQKRITDNAQAF